MQRFISAIALSAATGLALGSVLLTLGYAPPRGIVESAAPGMVIYRDPVTGAFGVPPPGALDEPSDSASSYSARANDGWRETADPRPGAGWKLEGPGTLISTVATIGPDGKLSIDCARAEGGVSR